MVKRVILLVFGSVLMIIGLLVALGGGAVMAITGSDNTLQSGSQRLSTPTSALVTPVTNISHTAGATDDLGQPDLRLSLTGAPNPTFVGVGPADAVDRYLAGAQFEQVNDLEFDPFRLITSTVPGTGRPVPPSTQTFWVAQASGTDPAINWKVTNGSYRLVIMNASGGPGVVTNGNVALRVPHLFAIGVSLLVGGLVVGLLGVLLLVLGLRSGRSRRPAVPPTSPGPWPGGGPPAQAPPPAQEGSSPAPSLQKPPE
jgi:hypothetical protein